MNRKHQVLFPWHQQMLSQVGEQVKLARKRRRLTTVQVAERASIDRATLYNIEKGKPKRFHWCVVQCIARNGPTRAHGRGIPICFLISG